MRNRKIFLSLAVLLMAIGFASISTTLYINGTTKISTSDLDVYFSNAKVDGVEDKNLILDDRHIAFSKEFKSITDTYTLDYDITNGSTNYDADTTINCTTEANDYITVTNSWTNSTTIGAIKTKSGTLSITMKQSYAGDSDLIVKIDCTINANAVERTVAGTDTPASKYENTNKYIVSGKLTDSTGSPASGAVVMYSEPKYAEVAVDGTYTISGVEAGYHNIYFVAGKTVSELQAMTKDEIISQATTTASINTQSKVISYNNGYKDNTFNIYQPKIYEIGEVVTIGEESFHVIKDNDDTVILFADYNLDTNYRQSTTKNYVRFSSSPGWDYTPGPQEIDTQRWSTNSKTYINNYVSYLKEQTGATANDTLTGDLITLTELGQLGCTISSNYLYISNYHYTCENSSNVSFIANGQTYWIRSADSGSCNNIWTDNGNGELRATGYNGSGVIRPVITISKSLI